MLIHVSVNVDRKDCAMKWGEKRSVNIGGFGNKVRIQMWGGAMHGAEDKGYR